MAKCPGKRRATNVNRVTLGKKYCMWLNLKPLNSFPVEIIGWRMAGNPTVSVPAPKKLKGMNPNYTILVREISTGRILTIVDTKDNGGAMYYGNQRATFHEI